MIHYRSVALIMSCGFLVANPQTATAQVERAGGGGGNNQLLQQYQQAASERSALQAQNTKLKKDLDDAGAKLAAATKELNALKSRTGASQAGVEAARLAAKNSEQALEDLRAKTQELLEKFRATVASLAGVEADRNNLKKQYIQSQIDFDVCVDRNEQLYELNHTVLDHYQRQGVWSALARGEPFTRIKQTQNENLIDQYRERAAELKQKRKPVDANARGAAVSTEPVAIEPMTTGK
jgi:chromosome segregation ATPase